MYRSILKLIPFMVITIVIMSFPMTQIYAGEQVKWKTFNEKNGLFSIKYPSNWFPNKIETPELINMFFAYQGQGSSFATLNLVGGDSIFTNVTDLLDSFSAQRQTFDKYQMVQPIECQKYMLNGKVACSHIESFKFELPDFPTKPIVNQLTVGAIDEDGMEYTVIYTAPKKVFDDFLPVAEEMIKSLNVTGTTPSSAGDSIQGSDGSPQLPPITDSPTVKKL